MMLPRRLLPVLMYHRVGPRRGGDPRMYVSLPTFRRQLDWLADHRFRTLTLDQAFEVLAVGAVPRRSVLLTVDDAFDDALSTIAPELTRRGMRATLFVPTGLLGGPPSFGGRAGAPTGSDPGRGEGDGRILDPAGVREWQQMGHDVGSHAVTHTDLTTLSPTQRTAELVDSRQRLEQLLERPVVDFCYPYAIHDAATRDAVRAAGYRAAYAGEPPIDDLHAVPRMMVFEQDSTARFARKLSGHYYWISGLHAWIRDRLTRRQSAVDPHGTR